LYDILNSCCECRTTFAVNAEFYCHTFYIFNIHLYSPHRPNMVAKACAPCSHDNFQSFRYKVNSKE